MSFAFYPVVILLAPAATGAMVGLLGRTIGPQAARAGVAAEVIALAFSLLVLAEVVAGGPRIVPLAAAHDGVLQFAFYLDRLSAVILVHIAAISALIHLFSIRYMQQDHGYARFHSLLAFTTFALFGMAASGNLLMLFIFWQLLSWLVPLLSHNYEHPPTVRGAFRTFVMQRFGDTAFFAGIVVAFGFYGTLDLQQLFARAADAQGFVTLWAGTPFEMRPATVVTLLIFVGAMSKSAQFPLHMWLPDSLYAPTPVHALLHAGIVNAGGFLLARLAPLYTLSPVTLHVVFAVGMLTTVLGSSMMLVQSDIKKTLGYSTIGQMGFMIMECGLGAYGLAIFHLIAHGLFKGTIFLNCGQVIHAARQEPRFPPADRTGTSEEFSTLTWLTGVVTTLILPLVIMLAAHGVLDIPLRDAQGTAIFLFFGWATSSQAILTLYRLRTVASWKVAAAMLSTLFLVVLTYLLAAESFTDFLFPAPGEVGRHFGAGALPGLVFDLLVLGFAVVIFLGWMLFYAKSHGRRPRSPAWVSALQLRLYALFINRLYLDAVAQAMGGALSHWIARLDGSRSLPYAAALIALGMAFVNTDGFNALSPATIAGTALTALALPLFPLHGIYVAALSRLPLPAAIGAALLLPSLGSFGAMALSSRMTPELRTAMSLLALTGALWGTFKALARERLTDIVTYAGLVFYSVLWWHLVRNEISVPQVVAFAGAVVLLSVTILLAWQRVQIRFGGLAPGRIGGLAGPMPRFAVLLSLLLMAAAGLPPFGPFFAWVALLLRPAGENLAVPLVVLLTWFAASWYLFRAMQRLLFLRPRTNLFYEDLRAGEVLVFSLLLLALAAIGMAPYGLVAPERLTYGYRALMETAPWFR